jgi:plastocyanin domain-containing protein
MFRESLLAAAVAVAVVACGRSGGNDTEPAPADARRIPIEVRKIGYVPNTLEAAANESVVLVFTRVEDTECGRFIQVKGTDARAELPMNTPVEVAVTMPAEGEVVFACGMDMMHGIIAVHPTPD